MKYIISKFIIEFIQIMLLQKFSDLIKKNKTKYIYTTDSTFAS